jgi:hypothetical protein
LFHHGEEELEAAKEAKMKKSLDLPVYLDMYQKDEVAATKESFSTKDLFGGKKTTMEKKSAKALFQDDNDL